MKRRVGQRVSALRLPATVLLAQSAPDSREDEEQQSQVLPAVFVVLAALWMTVKGVRATRTRHVQGKGGIEFHGRTAQVIGAISAAVGFALVVGVLYLLATGHIR